MDGSVLEEKSSFKMLGGGWVLAGCWLGAGWVLAFSSQLDCGYYIIPIGKTASKKIGAFIRSIKFLSSEVALYFYKSTTRSGMGYCCHAGLVISYKKRICKTVAPSLAASLDPLAHR